MGLSIRVGFSMKARVEVILRDEAGNVLRQLDTYPIVIGEQSVDDIEEAIEHLKQQALPELEAELLKAAQTEFTQQIKKTQSAL